MKARMNRRDFLRSAAMAAGLAASVPVLEACAAAAVPTPVVIKEKVVETVVVEKVVTTEKEVTKVVEKPVTQVVEKRVEVTPTPVPTPTVIWKAEPTATPVSPEVTLEGSCFIVTPGSKSHALMIDHVNRFMREHPGVKIELSPPGGLTWDAISARTKEGNPPEVVNVVDPTRFHAPFVEEWKAGWVWDMTEALNGPAYGLPGKTWKETFNPTIINSMVYEGRIPVIPIDVIAHPIIYYNKRTFRNLKLEVPKTWGELMAVCEALKKNGIEPWGTDKYDYNHMAQVEMALLRYIGLDDLKKVWYDTGKSFTDDDVVHVLQLFDDLVKKGYWIKGFLAMSDLEILMLMAQGKIGMMTTGSWLAGPDWNWPAGFEMGTFAWPQIEGGRGEPGMVQGYSNAYGVRAQSKNPAYGAEWLRFWTSVEIATAWQEVTGRVAPIQWVGPPSYSGSREAYDVIHKATAWHWGVMIWMTDGELFSANAIITKLLLQELTVKEAAEQLDKMVKEYWAKKKPEEKRVFEY